MMASMSEPQLTAEDGAKRGLLAVVAMTGLAVALLGVGAIAANVRAKRRNGRKRRR